ncbi:MAG: family 16 glycosylhydrolase [Pseudomonadota bacterium]
MIYVLLVMLLGGVSVSRADAPPVVFATNLGGEAFVAGDGTAYSAESGVVGGFVREVDVIKGSQDAALYQRMREGDFTVVHPVDAGTYDVTLHFAEPDEVRGGERVFDVLVEGEVVLRALDVMAYRDGKTNSALTITIPEVAVRDGRLEVAFDARAGRPVLSALVVREPYRPAAGEWTLRWQDEFDGDAVDDARWTAERWPARKVNDEDQAYTQRPRNLRLEDGELVIEAHRESFEGAQYTSARLQSSGKGDFLYGRFEVRARLPEGKGTWPAIWMLPSKPFHYATTCSDGEWQGNANCDAWPNSGEIDIMEHVGYQQGHVHGTVHNEAYYWVKWEQRKGRILLDDVADAYHVYALEWSPERIDAFVDDTHYFSYMNEGDGWRSWPYDQPFHLILNLAVGGVWGRAGGGIDPAVFPQQMRVDYVRVYQRTGGAQPAAASLPPRTPPRASAP